MKKVFICTNFRPFSGQPSCAYRGSKQLLSYLEQEIKSRGLDITIEASICMGHCPKGPNVKPSGGYFIHEATQQKLDDWLNQYELENR
jgi:NADH:ubiquinone oxidoreductase subunit E